MIDENQVLDMFRNDELSIAEISRATGVLRPQIKNILKSHGEETWKNRCTLKIRGQEKRNILSLYNQEKTIAEISKLTKHSRDAIRRALLRCSVRKEEVSKNWRGKLLRLGKFRQKVSDEQLLEKYNKGLTGSQIAKEFKMNGESIRKRLLKLGLDTDANYMRQLSRKKRLTAERRQKIIEMFETGKTIKEISRGLGYCERTVSQYLNKAGHKTKWSEVVGGAFAKNGEERKAQEKLTAEGFEIVPCYFICKRNASIPIPKSIVENYCSLCPIKEIPFYGTEFFDFLAKDAEGKFWVVEVKSTRRNTERRVPLSFSFSQGINIGRLVSAKVPVKILLYDGDGGLLDEINL
jgi:DNA-binding NarL/FixJ family response regulator